MAEQRLQKTRDVPLPEGYQFGDGAYYLHADFISQLAHSWRHRAMELIRESPTETVEDLDAKLTTMMIPMIRAEVKKSDADFQEAIEMAESGYGI